MNNKAIPLSQDRLESIARQYPTPFHIYDEAAIRANARRLKAAFAWNEGFKEYFAVKATPNPYLLALLKAELPSFFRSLDIKHEAFQWAPKSGSTENRTHPYLRTHLLAADYAVYDAERTRLLRRAEVLAIEGLLSDEADR